MCKTLNTEEYSAEKRPLISRCYKAISSISPATRTRLFRLGSGGMYLREVQYPKPTDDNSRTLCTELPYTMQAYETLGAPACDNTFVCTILNAFPEISGKVRDELQYCWSHYPQEFWAVYQGLVDPKESRTCMFD